MRVSPVRQNLGQFTIDGELLTSSSLTQSPSYALCTETRRVNLGTLGTFTWPSMLSRYFFWLSGIARDIYFPMLQDMVMRVKTKVQGIQITE